MEKRITKRDMFEMIMERVSDNTEMVEFLTHEIELLDKKKTSSKPSKTQVENESIKEEILNILNDSNVAMSITDIMGKLSDDYSNQKVSALVTQLVKSGLVVRDTVKGKAVFCKID